MEYQDTTTMLPTTTTRPLPALPKYQLSTNGTAFTPDGEDVQIQCGPNYISSLTSRTVAMVAQVYTTF
jgi:hypothetical protein